MRLNNVTHWWIPLPIGISLFAILALAPLFGWALAQESWIVVAALVMTALVPIVVRWPVVSTFGLYVFLVPFDGIPILATAGGTTLTKPVGMLAGVVLAVAGLMERRLGRPPLAALWWGLFMVWAALSAAWAIDPGKTFGRLPTALSMFLLYVISVSIRPSRKELYWVCLLAVMGGALAAAIGYLYGFEGVDASARGRLVIGDQESNPHALSAPLIVPLSLAIAGFVGLRGAVQKAMALGLVGLIGVGIYISMSRALVLAIIVTLSVLLYRMRFRWQIVAAAVVLLVVAGTMPDRFYQRINIVVTGEDATGSGRTEIWKVGVGAVERFGVFGAGLSNFHEAYSFYVVPEGPSGYAPTAHNVYLLVWVELGILGLVLMLAALGSHLITAHRAGSAGRGGVALAALEAGCFGVLMLTVFADIIWKKYFWLTLILLTWATYCEGRSDRHRRSGVAEGVHGKILVSLFGRASPPS